MDESPDRRGWSVPSAVDGRPLTELGLDSHEHWANGVGDRRRPWLVEFAGTPRAGKTSVIQGLSESLTEQGWRVHLVPEQAGRCPVPGKDNPHFNVWTTCSTICRILDGRYSSADIVLIDRGIFDALCWLEWHRLQGQSIGAEPDDHDGLAPPSKFATGLTDLTGLIDLVVVMIVDPAQGLRRDAAGRPGHQPGTIVNSRTLESINHSIGSVSARCGGDFRLESVDTSSMSKSDTLTHVKHIVHRARPVLAGPPPHAAVMADSPRQRTSPTVAP